MLTSSRIDHNDLITVLVGPSEESFTIHTAIASIKSPFFKAAAGYADNLHVSANLSVGSADTFCRRNWTEGQTKIVRLPEQDSEVFVVYFRWIYSDALDMTLISEPTETAIPPSFLNLCKLWMLSNYLQDFVLCNAVVDRALQKIATHEEDRTSFTVAPSTLCYVWDNLAPDAPFRTLCLDSALASRVPTHRADEIVKAMPDEVSLMLAARYVAGEEKPKPPGMEDKCKYHIHAGNEETCDV